MGIANFEPEKCEECGQSIEYLTPVDNGAVATLKAMAIKIGIKKINIVHPRKEMETKQKMPLQEMIRNGLVTSNMVGNLSKLRMNGLIAKTGDYAGNYCITRKGWKFLKEDLVIPKYAIRCKKTGRTRGYFEEKVIIVVLSDFDTIEGGFWEGINYEISEGRVYTEPPNSRQGRLI